MAASSYWLTAPKRFAQDRLVVFGLLIALLGLYLPGLGSYGLYDPWETHYGEVARTMVETGNYIDPWWGSPWDPADVKREKEGFYSKPPLTMWMQATGMNILGYNEWGVRLLFPLGAILALLAIYLAMARFFNRRAGLLAVAVAGTAPFYAMLGRQAVTDGPMVAIMTIGMMSLAVGLFLCDEDEEASPTLYWGVTGLLLLVACAQLWAMWPMDRSPDVVRPFAGDSFFRSIEWWFRETLAVAAGKGWALALFLAPIVFLAARRVLRQKRRRMLYVYLFYICCGLCVPAKGWLAWAPMGLAIIGYMLVTGEWRIFRQVDVSGGLLIVFVTGHPWVIAMIGGHDPEWYKRFIIHDHINRLFAGVHSIDDGGFEYFVRWIGYGLFPWIGALPAAIATVFGRLRKTAAGYTPEQKFQLLMLLWAVFGFFLFTRSKTKFHHYILPVIPPLAILIAIFLEDVLAKRARFLPVLLGSAAGVVLWVGQDLIRLPRAPGQASQNLVNLFTYKYDREWATYTDAAGLSKLTGDKLQNAVAANDFLLSHQSWLLWIGLLGVAGFLLLAVFRGWQRHLGTATLTLGGVLCTVFCLQVYLPDVSEDWSQKTMWDAYYAHCTKYGPDEEAEFRRHLLTQSMRVPSKLDTFPRAWCKEPVVAFRTNWRGETFYSANTVIPAPETKHLKPFLDQWGNDKPFYLFTERNRVQSELEPNLPAHLKRQYDEIFGANLKFVMLRIEKKERAAQQIEPEAQRDAPIDEPPPPE
ncbi:MAG: glycosyltransferase family 39 protein [bacterium]